MLFFDADADGITWEPGDDYYFYSYDYYDPTQSKFVDAHFTAGFSGFDVLAGGTNDGAGAFGHSSGSTVFEMVHPLNSSDNSHDFSLAPGQDAGMQWLLQLGSSHTIANTYYPSPSDVIRLHLAPAQGTLQAEIDIRPDDPLNRISCNNPDFIINAAILTTDRLRMINVDHTTLRLAGAQDIHRGDNGLPIRHVQYFDGDRAPDLALHVRLGDTSLTCSSVEAIVDGRTLSGQPFEGRAAVQMIGGTQPVRLLVDASRDGGAWWFPQAGPFDPELIHQGKPLADYMRSKGWIVDELARGEVISNALLAQYDIVMRTGAFGMAYSAQELAAYEQFLSRPTALVLAVDGNSPPDALAVQVGITFVGSGFNGTVTDLAVHPITKNVSSFQFPFGQAVAPLPPGPGMIIGWLPGTIPVMGVTQHGNARVFFVGDVNGLQLVQQPFTDNLLNWLLTGM
jgi:hypothetical protein